MLSDISIENYR